MDSCRVTPSIGAGKKDQPDRCRITATPIAFSKNAPEEFFPSHGPSTARCADEDNITPPDRMFPRDGINNACQHCHRQTLPMTAQHKAVLARKFKEVCTNCHGEHRLSHRTRRWNRQTGELIADDNVRMMTDEMLGED